MTATDILGYIAGIVTTLAMLPQVLKAWQTHSTKDISLPTFSLLSVGVVLWTIYGFAISSIPMVLGNIVGGTLAGTILVLKFRYR